MIAQVKGQIVGIETFPPKPGKDQAHRLSVLTQLGNIADVSQVVVVGNPPKQGDMFNGPVQVTGYYFGKAQCRAISNGAAK